MPPDSLGRHDPDNEQDQMRWNYYSNAAHYRGMFVDLVSVIDLHLNRIIAQYLCPGKTQRNIFLKTIMHDDQHSMTMSHKIKILQAILKTLHPGEESSQKELIKNLNEARRMRNDMAHMIITVNADGAELTELVRRQEIQFMCDTASGMRKIVQSDKIREMWKSELSRLIGRLAETLKDIESGSGSEA